MGTNLSAIFQNFQILGSLLESAPFGKGHITDHLEGDVYFKTKRPGHNLDRCRTQLALVKSIEEQEEAMRAIVREVAK